MATDLEATAERSRAAWRRLRLRLQSVTPAQLARSLLVAAAAAIVIRVTAAAWSDLLPFQLGLVLAYITLPVVNWLDRFMPRWLAASLLVLLEFGAAVGGIALVVPPLLQELNQLSLALPSVPDVQSWLLELNAFVQTLPPPIQVLLRNTIEQIVNNVRDNAGPYVQTVLQLALGTVVGLFGTLGFLVGFLGIPTWLVAVMSDQKAGVHALNRVLPASVRPDFWAVMRILDRPFSAFVRGQLVFGLATALTIYAGFAVLERLHLSSSEFRVVLAIVAGLTQLIPVVGPLLGAVPAVALGLVESPSAGVATLSMYVTTQFLLNAIASPLLATRYVNIHPAVFVVVLVLLSQFGFVWLLLAAPLSMVLRDLFIYAYGRLSEPPRPAGLGPGDRHPAPSVTRRARGMQPAPPEVAHG